jgi:hypothetical protein
MLLTPATGGPNVLRIITDLILIMRSTTRHITVSIITRHTTTSIITATVGIGGNNERTSVFQHLRRP